MYGHSILRIIAEEVKKSGPFSIMCDGTQDITLEYQEYIVIRYIDENLKVQEICIGFYSSTSSTTSTPTGESIANMLKDTIRYTHLFVSVYPCLIYVDNVMMEHLIIRF